MLLIDREGGFLLGVVKVPVVPGLSPQYCEHPITDIADIVICSCIKEDFIVLSNAYDAKVTDLDQGEACAAAGRALKLGNETVFVMVSFIFDVEGAPIGPLKRVELHRFRLDDPTLDPLQTLSKFAELSQDDLTEILEQFEEGCQKGGAS